MLFVREDCESKQDPEKFPFKPANESFFRSEFGEEALYLHQEGQRQR